MNCDQGVTTSMVWAVVIGSIVLLSTYGIISSNLQARRLRAKRELEMPAASPIRSGEFCSLTMKDGKQMPNLIFDGVVHKEDCGTLGLADRMIVFKRTSGERLFVRQASILMIESAPSL